MELLEVFHVQISCHYEELIRNNNLVLKVKLNTTLVKDLHIIHKPIIIASTIDVTFFVILKLFIIHPIEFLWLFIYCHSLLKPLVVFYYLEKSFIVEGTN